MKNEKPGKRKKKTTPPDVLEAEQAKEGASKHWDDSLVLNRKALCEGCELAELGEDCPPECIVFDQEAPEETES